MSKPSAAKYKPIVTKLFMERIQMDCVDMQGFAKGLTVAYDVLPDKEKEKVNFDQLAAQVDVICNDRMRYPRYLVNIADHTSKFGDCSAVESKRVGTMAWLLLNFVSHFGTPKILHKIMEESLFPWLMIGRMMVLGL